MEEAVSLYEAVELQKEAGSFNDFSNRTQRLLEETLGQDSEYEVDKENLDVEAWKI